jgi:hypothetical protein
MKKYTRDDLDTLGKQFFHLKRAKVKFKDDSYISSEWAEKEVECILVHTENVLFLVGDNIPSGRNIRDENYRIYGQRSYFFDDTIEYFTLEEEARKPYILKVKILEDGKEFKKLKNVRTGSISVKGEDFVSFKVGDKTLVLEISNNGIITIK